MFEQDNALAKRNSIRYIINQIAGLEEFMLERPYLIKDENLKEVRRDLEKINIELLKIWQETYKQE